MSASTELRGPARLLPRTTSPRLSDRPLTSYHLVLGAGGALLVIGLMMVFSATSVTSLVDEGSIYSSFATQAVYAGIGLVGFWFALRIRPGFLRRLAIPGIVVAILALLAVLVVGEQYNGARRWIEIGGQTLQPSELAKLAFVVWGADLLVRKAKLITQWRHLLIPLLPVGALLGLLVMLQPNLGTTLIFVLILLALLWSVGAPMRLFVVLGGAMIGLFCLLIAIAPYRLARLTAFLDPFADPQGATLQAARGIYALATGGWWGVGLGNSRMKWGLLPESDSDYIFAIIGEELGFAGCLLVLTLYGVLAYAGLRIARRTQDGFIRLASAAITAWLTGQALINVGYVVGLLPITGLPLPLISSGGTSLTLTIFVIGLLANFARHEPAAVALLKRRRRSRWARLLAPTPISAVTTTVRTRAAAARPARAGRPGTSAGRSRGTGQRSRR